MPDLSVWNMAPNIVRAIENNICPTFDKKGPLTVQCDVCKTWYHTKCALPHLKDDQVDKHNWYCGQCKEIGVIRKSSLDAMIEKANNKIDALKKEHEDELTRLKNEMDELRNALGGAENAEQALS